MRDLQKEGPHEEQGLCMQGFVIAKGGSAMAIENGEALDDNSNGNESGDLVAIWIRAVRLMRTANIRGQYLDRPIRVGRTQSKVAR